jgi:hypothetical protein
MLTNTAGRIHSENDVNTPCAYAMLQKYDALVTPTLRLKGMKIRTID